MKTQIKLVSFFFILSITLGYTQIKTPQPSPAAKLEQKVGLTDISIEYSRPGVKGRTIYGDLVPYDKLWRTGANANTTITFSTAVKVNGKDLEKGKYALYTVPNMKSWEFVFYKENENWGAPKEFSEEKVALRVSATPITIAANIENMLFVVDEIKDNSALIELLWASTVVGINIEVPTNDLVMKSIETTMAGASKDDYYKAAVYYKDMDKDLSQALAWINKAIELGEGNEFWYVRQKSEIQANMKDYKGAIISAKKSLVLSEEAKYDSYIKINKENIAKWSKM